MISGGRLNRKNPEKKSLCLRENIRSRVTRAALDQSEFGVDRDSAHSLI
jgi:hypothetical protein